MEGITLFRGKYGFLSNMYDCMITIDSKTFKNGEAAFHYGRAAYKDDADLFQLMTGIEAKKRANIIKKSKSLQKPDWFKINEDWMYQVQYAKYTQNPELKEKLLATGDAIIIEGNDWGDTYWGMCNGVGSNKLGKIIMRVREELRTGVKFFSSEFKSIMDIKF